MTLVLKCEVTKGLLSRQEALDQRAGNSEVLTGSEANSMGLLSQLSRT